MATAHVISPVIAPEFPVSTIEFHKTWYQKCHQFVAGLLTLKAASDPAWASALPSLLEMDARLLDDLGAPQWARETVLRQREERTRAIAQILGGRNTYGCLRLD
jgi:hypothetical protein